MKEERNPASVHTPLAAYAHQIELSADERLLVMSGQVGMTVEGEIPDEPGDQLDLALANVLRNLEAAGMHTADLVKLTFYFAEAVDADRRRAILDARLRGHTPCMTLIYVAGLASPELKVELDAWASAGAQVPTFNLQFPAKEIESLASRFGYTDDARLLALGAAARARGHYTRQEFVEVCAWKTPRSRPKVASNSAAAVTTATGRALAAADEATRMSALLELTGVGVPTASVLLFFAFPDAYPILDVRALESLGVKPRSQYPVSFWLEYLRVCRELARRHGVNIRTLDKALWQHSKEASGA